MLRKFMITLYLLFTSSVFAAGAVILQDIFGKQIPFSSLQGKWVFINFWASWCQPCLDEIKEFNHFYSQHKQQIALFAVNFDELSGNELQALIKQYGIHYPSLQAASVHQLRLGEQVSGVPVTFVFNPQGEQVNVLYGPQTLKTLTRVMD